MLKITSKSLNVEMEVPHEEDVVNIDVNLKEGTVQIYYKEWGGPLEVSTIEESSTDAASMRYDGELDDPDHPVSRVGSVEPRGYERSRPVKDNPQA